VVEELADLVEGQPGALGDVDDRQAPEARTVVAALAGDAAGLREQARCPRSSG
jgi:hypothetical protein